MLQPPGSVIELCHVVVDMDKAIQHWTTIMGAGPFYVGEMRFEEGHRYRGEPAVLRSEEHTSELQSLMRISYAVFCLKKKKKTLNYHYHRSTNETCVLLTYIAIQ